MSICSVARAARELGSAPRALIAVAVEQLVQHELIANPAVDATLEVLLDRLCLSLAVAKPVGLSTWAAREGRRFGVAGASELAAAATHSIAVAASRLDVDHARLLAALELLKEEVDRGLAPLREPAEPHASPSAAATHALLAMLGERDAATCCHSKATGEWARRLAVAMGLSAETTAFVERCAVLHDIGKVATPESILLKDGPLDEDEWTVMRDHSAAGERILEQIPSLRTCAVIVRAHHERYDGDGYPDRLAANEIPFEARVVAVADAFHAMISDRPYRRAIAPRQALEILRNGRGTQWDPQAVDALLGLFYRTAADATTETKSNISSAS
ncbi:MAG TPA: HD-GYP domain-containing protein [Verrucomicrobiae bacterium]|jgi:putative nucleotidyltransferase with HDIG domain|nr:HD-GYP domain-containing protein [Verrucomicrobiae bacterium]